MKWFMYRFFYAAVVCHHDTALLKTNVRRNNKEPKPKTQNVSYEEHTHRHKHKN